MLPLDGDRKPAPVLQMPFNETQGSFSPDGRWIAYVSDESGRPEVYVQTFPVSAAKWRISSGGERTQYAAASDGQRFLVNVQVGGQAAQPITVVLAWTADLKK